MKNPPKTRDKQGPAPVIDACPGCGVEFHSKFEKRRHICRRENRYG